MKNDDFDEDEDFSLDDDSEEDADDDEAFSAGEDAEDDDDEDDEGGDALPSDESDFQDAPKRPAKRAKTSKASPRKKPAASKTKAKAAPAAAKPAKKPSVVANKAPGVKASPSPAGKNSGGSSASTPQAAPIKAGDAEGVVLDYMRKMNRPYSMLNVFENLHRAIAKPSLTKLLDNLVDKGELKSKTYGKAKIYYLNQDQLPAPSEEERAQVEVRIKELESECAQVEQELRASEVALASVNSQISDADLEVKLRELSEETQTLTAKLETLERPDRVPVSPGRKDKLKKRFTTLRAAWVTRKRIAMDALDQIADGMEKKPKVVMDLCGIETDADAGVKEIPSI